MISARKIPLVSIMMPVYNGRRLIEASIQSILNQTYSNWECIIVDDGSTDNTGEYIDSLPLIDRRFRIIHHSQNKGRATARQTALDAATGKYLAMLDAEDLWHPEKLETQVRFLEENQEVALIVSGMISFGTRTEILRERGYPNNEIIKFDGNKAPIHAASMLRVKIAKEYKYDTNLKLAEDAIFLKNYLENKYYATQRESYYYYSEFDSVSKKKILRTYKGVLSKFMRDGNVSETAKMFMKLVVFYISSPFISIETIIKKRGISPNKYQINYFESNIRPIIDATIEKDS